MFQFILDNVGTIVVTLALAGIVAAVLLTLRRDRRKGKSACGCGCGSCPMAGACHKSK